MNVGYTISFFVVSLLTLVYLTIKLLLGLLNNKLENPLFLYRMKEFYATKDKKLMLIIFIMVYLIGIYIFGVILVNSYNNLF